MAAAVATAGMLSASMATKTGSSSPASTATCPRTVEHSVESTPAAYLRTWLDSDSR